MDYIIQVSERGVEGLWLCTVCGSTNRDFGMAHFHVKHDHSEIKCRFCNLYCNNFLTLDTHMQEAHSGQMPVQCQICMIWLPDATVLMPHFQWHGDPNRSLIPHRYAEECPNCHLFLAHGKESSDHRAFCVRKPESSVRNNCQAPGTPESDSMTHQNSDNAPTRTLRQIVRETLRGPTHPDAATIYQPTNNGTRPDEMNHKIKSDEQEIEVLSGESDYWRQFKEEV